MIVPQNRPNQPVIMALSAHETLKIRPSGIPRWNLGPKIANLIFFWWRKASNSSGQPQLSLRKSARLRLCHCNFGLVQSGTRLPNPGSARSENQALVSYQLAQLVLLHQIEAAENEPKISKDKQSLKIRNRFNGNIWQFVVKVEATSGKGCHIHFKQHSVSMKVVALGVKCCLGWRELSLHIIQQSSSCEQTN